MESDTYYFTQSPNLFKNENNNNNNNRLSTEEKKIPKNEFSKFHEYLNILKILIKSLK